MERVVLGLHVVLQNAFFRDSLAVRFGENVVETAALPLQSFAQNYFVVALEMPSLLVTSGHMQVQRLH